MKIYFVGKKHLIFEEYLEADSHFLTYSRSHNFADLDKLVATLYRPRNKFSKHRLPFNTNSVPRYAIKLRKLNSDIKFAILLYYQGCRKFLTYNFPHVFNSSVGSTKKGFGPLALIDALTGDDVTKTDAVRKSLLYNVLVRLEQSAIKNEEMETKLKKLKNK